MNTGDFIDRFSQELADTGHDISTRAATDRVFKTFLSTIQEVLASGESVRLPGFGVFEVVQRKARQGRNPQTGESIKIPAQKVLRFRASKTFNASLNAKKRSRAKVAKA